MIQIWKAISSLLLALSLSACGGVQQAAPSSSSREPASLSSAESSKPILISSSSGHRTALETTSGGSVLSDVPAPENDASGRQIQITTEEGSILIFELHDSTAADDLYSQLPFTVPAEDFGGNEKIFYPPAKLDTSDTPLAQGPAGTLAYYAPWGNIAIFYSECNGASGLYALGEAVSGSQYIPQITGEIHIEAVGTPETASAPQQIQPLEVSETAAKKEDRDNMRDIQVAIGDKTFTAALYDNEAAQSFAAMLPLTLDMSEMNGNEKYDYLSESLPADPTRPSGIHNGDLMLYGSDCLALFYESFSTSYSYTPLGAIDDPSGLAEALGGGSIQITISLRA